MAWSDGRHAGQRGVAPPAGGLRDVERLRVRAALVRAPLGARGGSSAGTRRGVNWWCVRLRWRRRGLWRGRGCWRGDRGRRVRLFHLGGRGDCGSGLGLSGCPRRGAEGRSGTLLLAARDRLPARARRAGTFRSHTCLTSVGPARPPAPFAVRSSLDFGCLLCHSGRSGNATTCPAAPRHGRVARPPTSPEASREPVRSCGAAPESPGTVRPDTARERNINPELSPDPFHRIAWERRRDRYPPVIAWGT